MTSNNETVSRQKSLSGQHCKIYDVSSGNSALLPANVDRLRLRCLDVFVGYITNHLMTGLLGNS